MGSRNQGILYWDCLGCALPGMKAGRFEMSHPQTLEYGRASDKLHENSLKMDQDVSKSLEKKPLTHVRLMMNYAR